MRHPPRDYSQAGAYFVTIRVRGKTGVWLSRVKHGRSHSYVDLTRAGMILPHIWSSIPNRYSGVLVDRHVIMPDHFHGIIIQGAVEDVFGVDGVVHDEGFERRRTRRRQMLLPKVIGYLKMNASKQINQVYQRKGRLWQRSYYDQVIRNTEHLENVRRYIERNPQEWRRSR